MEGGDVKVGGEPPTLDTLRSFVSEHIITLNSLALTAPALRQALTSAGLYNVDSQPQAPPAGAPSGPLYTNDLSPLPTLSSTTPVLIPASSFTMNLSSNQSTTVNAAESQQVPGIPPAAVEILSAGYQLQLQQQQQMTLQTLASFLDPSLHQQQLQQAQVQQQQQQQPWQSGGGLNLSFGAQLQGAMSQQTTDQQPGGFRHAAAFALPPAMLSSSPLAGLGDLGTSFGIGRPITVPSSAPALDLTSHHSALHLLPLPRSAQPFRASLLDKQPQQQEHHMTNQQQNQLQMLQHNQLQNQQQPQQQQQQQQQQDTPHPQVHLNLMSDQPHSYHAPRHLLQTPQQQQQQRFGQPLEHLTGAMLPTPSPFLNHTNSQPGLLSLALPLTNTHQPMRASSTSRTPFQDSDTTTTADRGQAGAEMAQAGNKPWDGGIQFADSTIRPASMHNGFANSGLLAGDPGACVVNGGGINRQGRGEIAMQNTQRQLPHQQVQQQQNQQNDHHLQQQQQQQQFAGAPAELTILQTLQQQQRRAVALQQPGASEPPIGDAIQHRDRLGSNRSSSPYSELLRLDSLSKKGRAGKAAAAERLAAWEAGQESEEHDEDDDSKPRSRQPSDQQQQNGATARPGDSKRAGSVYNKTSAFPGSGGGGGSGGAAFVHPHPAPVIDGTELVVQVVCSITSGEFLPEMLMVRCACMRCGTRTPTGSMAPSGTLISPTEFERHAGLGSAKKWRTTIKLVTDGSPIGKWLTENGVMTKPRPSGSRHGRAGLLRPPYGVGCGPPYGGGPSLPYGIGNLYVGGDMSMGQGGMMGPLQEEESGSGNSGSEDDLPMQQQEQQLLPQLPLPSQLQLNLPLQLPPQQLLQPPPQQQQQPLQQSPQQPPQLSPELLQQLVQQPIQPPLQPWPSLPSLPSPQLQLEMPQLQPQLPQQKPVRRKPSQESMQRQQQKRRERRQQQREDSQADAGGDEQDEEVEDAEVEAEESQGPVIDNSVQQPQLLQPPSPQQQSIGISTFSSGLLDTQETKPLAVASRLGGGRGREAPPPAPWQPSCSAAEEVVSASVPSPPSNAKLAAELDPYLLPCFEIAVPSLPAALQLPRQPSLQVELGSSPRARMASVPQEVDWLQSPRKMTTSNSFIRDTHASLAAAAAAAAAAVAEEQAEAQADAMDTDNVLLGLMTDGPEEAPDSSKEGTVEGAAVMSVTRKDSSTDIRSGATVARNPSNATVFLVRGLGGDASGRVTRGDSNRRQLSINGLSFRENQAIEAAAAAAAAAAAEQEEEDEALEPRVGDEFQAEIPGLLPSLLRRGHDADGADGEAGLKLAWTESELGPEAGVPGPCEEEAKRVSTYEELPQAELLPRDGIEDVYEHHQRGGGDKRTLPTDRQLRSRRHQLQREASLGMGKMRRSGSAASLAAGRGGAMESEMDDGGGSEDSEGPPNSKRVYMGASAPRRVAPRHVLPPTGASANPTLPSRTGAERLLATSSLLRRTNGSAAPFPNHPSHLPRPLPYHNPAHNNNNNNNGNSNGHHNNGGSSSSRNPSLHTPYQHHGNGGDERMALSSEPRNSPSIRQWSLSDNDSKLEVVISVGGYSFEGVLALAAAQRGAGAAETSRAAAGRALAVAIADQMQGTEEDGPGSSSCGLCMRFPDGLKNQGLGFRTALGLGPLMGVTITTLPSDDGRDGLRARVAAPLGRMGGSLGRASTTSGAAGSGRGAGGGKTGSLLVHRQCVAWSPEVSVVKGELKGTDAAVLRGFGMKCQSCGDLGATLSCQRPGCDAAFHLPCARESACTILSGPYTFMCPLHSSGGNSTAHHASPSQAGPLPPSRSRLAAVFTSAQQQQQHQQQMQLKPHLRSPPSPPVHRDHRDTGNGRSNAPVGTGFRGPAQTFNHPSTLPAHRAALSARMQANLQANGRPVQQPPIHDLRGNDNAARHSRPFPPADSRDPARDPARDSDDSHGRENSACQNLTQQLQRKIREQRVSNSNTPWSKGNQARAVARGLREDEREEAWEGGREGRRREAEESEDEEVAEDHFQRDKAGRARREGQYAERAGRGGKPRDMRVNADRDDESDGGGFQNGSQQLATHRVAGGHTAAVPTQRKRRRAPATNFGPVSRDAESASDESDGGQREVRRRGPAPSFPMSASRPPASATAKFRANSRTDLDVEMDRDESQDDRSEDDGPGSDHGPRESLRPWGQQPSASANHPQQHPRQRIPLPGMPHASSEAGQQRQKTTTDAERHHPYPRPTPFTAAAAAPFDDSAGIYMDVGNDSINVVPPADGRELRVPDDASGGGDSVAWNAAHNTADPFPSDTAPRTAISTLIALNAAGQYIRTRPMGNGDRDNSAEQSDASLPPPAHSTLDLNSHPQRPSAGPWIGLKQHQQQTGGGGSSGGVGLNLQRHGDATMSTDDSHPASGNGATALHHQHQHPSSLSLSQQQQQQQQSLSRMVPGARCQVCIVQRKGKCGTDSAPKKCMKRGPDGSAPPQEEAMLWQSVDPVLPGAAAAAVSGDQMDSEGEGNGQGVGGLDSRDTKQEEEKTHGASGGD